MLFLQEDEVTSTAIAVVVVTTKREKWCNDKCSSLVRWVYFLTVNCVSRRHLETNNNNSSNEQHSHNIVDFNANNT